MDKRVKAFISNFCTPALRGIEELLNIRRFGL